MPFQRLLIIGALIFVPITSFFATLWLIDHDSFASKIPKKAEQTEVGQWKIIGPATFSTDSSGTVTMRGPDTIYQEFSCNSHCEAELSIYVVRADRATIGIMFLNAKREILQNLHLPIDHFENKPASIKRSSSSANIAFVRLYVFSWDKTNTVSFKDATMSVR